MSYPEFTVTSHGSMGCAANWRDETYRYHFWIKVNEAGEACGAEYGVMRHRPTIFRNTVAKQGKPTVYLDGDAAKWRGMIKYMVRIINKSDLLTKAIAKEKADQARAEAEECAAKAAGIRAALTGLTLADFSAHSITAAQELAQSMTDNELLRLSVAIHNAAHEHRRKVKQ